GPAGSARMSPWVHPSPTGRHVAVHDLNMNAPEGRWSVGVYELAGGKEVRRFEGTGLLQGLTWSADGGRLAGVGYPLQGEQGFVFVGDLATSQPPCPQTVIPRKCDRPTLALSPDGKTVAFSPDGRI